MIRFVAHDVPRRCPPLIEAPWRSTNTREASTITGAHDALGQENGHAALTVELTQDCDHAVGLGRTQASHYLIEQQQLGIGGERTRDFQALAVGQCQP